VEVYQVVDGKKGVDPKGFKIANTLIISFMLFGATGFGKNRNPGF